MLSVSSISGAAISAPYIPVSVPAPGDTAAPTVTAAAVANAAPTSVILTASEALDPAYVPASSAFTVAGHNVTGVSVSGSTIGLIVTPAFANGEAARAAAYDQPTTGGARDLAGNLLASFTGRAIANNVAAPAAPENPGFIRSKTRTIKVKAAPLTFEGSRFWNLSDPRHPVGSIDVDATIDISFDWTEVLDDIGDTIASVYFDISGLTSLGGYYIGGFATIFVTAPTDTPRITCRITTNSVPARIEDRTVFLTIEEE